MWDKGNSSSSSSDGVSLLAKHGYVKVCVEEVDET